MASGVLMSLGMGFYAYGFSVLFKPISSELGFTRAVTSVAASIGRFEGGFEAPLSGWATDRFGPKWIVVSGIVVVGLGLILMNFINSLWAFYVVWGVIIGTGANIGVSLPLDTTIANWFVKKRGVAQGLKWVIAGSLLAPLLPIVAWLITIVGWRMTCVIIGLVMWFVALPLAWFSLRRHRPEYYGLLPDGATVEEETTDTDQMIDRGVEYAAEVQEVEFTLRQAMRTPTFWLLIAAQSSHAMAMPVISIHAVPFLTDIGIAPVKAAAMFSTMLLSSIPLRFVGGFLADRVTKQSLRFLVGGAYLVQAAGFAAIMLDQTTPIIYTWFVLYGIGYGVAMPLNSLMRARYFGRKAFGSIAGLSRMLMTPVGIAIPVYVGWVYDTTGIYTSTFGLVAAMVAFAAVLMFLTRPPKPPAQITDVRKIM